MTTRSHTNTRMKHRKQAIIDFVARYHAEHGYAPTRREIADAVGYRSTGSLNSALWQMVDDGELTADAKIARSIRVAKGVQ